MAKKEFFLILDSETTITDLVYDFGAVIVDRHGNIQTKCAILIQEAMQDDLFYDHKTALWSKANAAAKKVMYADMITAGNRSIASVAAVNRWLEKAIGKYNPMLTAYNLAFDAGKCANTGIDLSGFTNRFCLWHLAVAVFGNTKNFRAFALQNHYFGNRTALGNMTITTNAEIMAHFVSGEFVAEPHTAIEDAIGFELPILVAALKKKDWKKKIGIAYNWRNLQVKDSFHA